MYNFKIPEIYISKKVKEFIIRNEAMLTITYKLDESCISLIMGVQVYVLWKVDPISQYEQYDELTQRCLGPILSESTAILLQY